MGDLKGHVIINNSVSTRPWYDWLLAIVVSFIFFWKPMRIGFISHTKPCVWEIIDNNNTTITLGKYK